MESSAARPAQTAARLPRTRSVASFCCSPRYYRPARVAHARRSGREEHFRERRERFYGLACASVMVELSSAVKFCPASDDAPEKLNVWGVLRFTKYGDGGKPLNPVPPCAIAKYS